MKRDEHRGMKTLRVFLAAAILACAVVGTPALARPIDEWTTATFNELCIDEKGAALAASVPSDLLVRCWFKWADARNYQVDKAVIPLAKARGASFGGGVTVSALYRQENGLTPDQWRRLATRDPLNHILPAWGFQIIAHPAMSSEDYLDYLLRWCYAQIDAGVDNIFFDEVEGACTGMEGYDDAAMAKFAAWLIHKYCDGQGWTPRDPRWREQFGVNLADTDVCPDGTIKSLDYRAYLGKHGLASDPFAQDNRLRAEFGSPGSGEDSFWGWRDDWAWKYVCDHFRDYARKQGREVFITANNLHKYVDYQTYGLKVEWDGDAKHVTTNASYLRKYRRVVLNGWDLAGKHVPVVFFNDWDFDHHIFKELSPADRIRWMKVYAPEIYAAGGIFCFPVNIAAPEDLEVMKRYLVWYDEHRSLFHGGDMVATGRVEVSNEHVTAALWELGGQKKRVVHLINHTYDARAGQSGDLVPVDNVTVTIASGREPLAVSWVSPEAQGDRPLGFIYGDGVVTVKTPRIEGYGAIVLAYEELPTGDGITPGGVAIMTRGAWARAAVNRFVVTPDGKINNPDQLLSCIHGQMNAQLRNNPTFVVDYPADGRFLVHVNSVAALGATLGLYLDGRLALNQDLPDLDKRDLPGAAEYDQDFGIDVPRGKHEIRIDNTGVGWVSVDYVLLVKYK